jgi:serine/threonine-protein kinase
MTEPTRVGDIIDGKYRVERVLGRGGMGIVVAARHLRLGQEVAIKFPVARLSLRSDVVARLVREGRAAMAIRSEHVARVHDVGTLDGGEPYLVMEYLVGHDLGEILAGSGPLPIATAVEYILQATEALAEAHARGIIHRDLKPSNLFLSQRPDGSPLVKLIDFGISKSANGDLDPLRTDPGAVIGSPLYMAPEQMRSVREVDARSDIWALGATLHTLVSGEPPFEAGTLVEIHERILRGTPLLRATRPDAPAALEAALLRCMQRDPADRYATVADLADALAAVAPEHARGSALRARRILAAAPLEPTSPRAPSDLPAPIAAAKPVEAAGATATAPVPSWGDGDRLLARRDPGGRPPRRDADPLAPTERQPSLDDPAASQGATATASNPSWDTADRLPARNDTAVSMPLDGARRARAGGPRLLALAGGLAVIALLAARGLRQTTQPTPPLPSFAAISPAPPRVVAPADTVTATMPSSSATAVIALPTGKLEVPKVPLRTPILRVASPPGRSPAASNPGGPRPSSAATEPPRAPPPPPDPLADPD